MNIHKINIMINKSSIVISFVLKTFLVFSFLVCFGSVAIAQSNLKANLANEYYNSGEYEKASELYEKLYLENNRNMSYFNRYVQCLLEVKSYEKAEKLVKDELKRVPDQLSLYVILGNIYERQADKERADKEYRKAIDKLTPDASSIVNLANAFTNLTKYNLAIETYLKGEKVTKIENLYAYNLAELYRRDGDKKNMIKYNLLTLEKEGNNIQQTQTNFQRFFQEEDYKELQAQLYQLIQDRPSKTVYVEMLEWTFITQKEYSKALRQSKALDRQREENGIRVFNLANIAYQDEDYDTSIDAYTYIVENKSKNSTYYLESRRGLLNSKKSKIVYKYDYTKSDLQSLKDEYLSFFGELGKNTQTAQLMLEYAEFEGIYLNDLPIAISTLEEIINFGGLNKDIIAKAKLLLGDFYLMNGERWDASLLFSQVDKDFKEGNLGEMARYRNAKLSYYSGDFEWAQEQFKILKGATSKLISNDAIDMAVFILDNLGLDTTEVTLEMFAAADLLIFQNKFDEALVKLDSIKIIFPEHSLEDDVLYQKAQIYKKMRKGDLFVESLQTIIEKHSDDIKADNAIFELAEYYEFGVKDLEKAKSLYEKLFLDYSDSTFAVEARRRYRVLRGDEI